MFYLIYLIDIGSDLVPSSELSVLLLPFELALILYYGLLASSLLSETSSNLGPSFSLPDPVVSSEGVLDLGLGPGGPPGLLGSRKGFLRWQTGPWCFFTWFINISCSLFFYSILNSILHVILCLFFTFLSLISFLLSDWLVLEL